MTLVRAKTATFSALCGLLVLSIGCGGAGDRPDIGQVSGVVTLDGQPLGNASVSFAQPGLRPSIGYTNPAGEYELFYIRDIRGAAVGTHTVRIDLVAKNNRLPAVYNTKSTLTREVKPGKNDIDFKLTSSP